MRSHIFFKACLWGEALKNEKPGLFLDLGEHFWGYIYLLTLVCVGSRDKKSGLFRAGGLFTKVIKVSKCTKCESEHL